MLIFVVEWLCGCGCGELKRVYLSNKVEADRIVAELEVGEKPIEIWIYCHRLPRTKAAVLTALNDASGVPDLVIPGVSEELLHLIRNDVDQARTPPNEAMH
jgi:hypothetical protein